VTATTRDPATADTYVQVVGMLAHPRSLFAPRVLAAAARARPHGDSTPSPVRAAQR
jgi:hypothetical protein